MCEIQFGTMHSIEFILALIAPPPPNKVKLVLIITALLKINRLRILKKKTTDEPNIYHKLFSKTAFVTFILEKERLGEGRWG